uniref:Uncharacterized protein n=1 Tax=Romanomermis culicivorax TaxID=13658 RepID=A0A915IEQ9_ROMCU
MLKLRGKSPCKDDFKNIKPKVMDIEFEEEDLETQVETATCDYDIKIGKPTTNDIDSDNSRDLQVETATCDYDCEIDLPKTNKAIWAVVRRDQRNSIPSFVGYCSSQRPLHMRPYSTGDCDKRIIELDFMIYRTAAFAEIPTTAPIVLIIELDFMICRTAAFAEIPTTALIVLSHLYLPFLAERNGMQSTQRYQTKGKFSFRLVRLKVTVGHFLENCSYPLRSKVDFQAERFELLAIGSVPSR